MVGIFLPDRPTTATGIRMAGCDWTSARPRRCAHAPPHSSRVMCGASFFPPSANAVAAAYMPDDDARAAKRTRGRRRLHPRARTRISVCATVFMGGLRR